MTTRLLGYLDTLLHRTLDGYISAQRPGWGLLQVAQHHICIAYEERNE